MELFYAHYASLESFFLKYVAQTRRQPLEPWLVVCASSFLGKRLAAELAHKQGAVANMHFCTISSLLHELDAEAGPALPVFPQDHLRDFLLKDILSQPGLNRYPVSRGLISVLKSSLRDLADSLADPAVLEEQLNVSADDSFAPDKERFAWLVRVYRRYLEREAQMPGYRPYQDLFERALNQVEKSSFLQHFSKIVFYGFYDMPGRPLELLRQINTHYSPVVFAPYGKYPAYQFAQKFFETNWLGTAGGGTDVNEENFGALGPSGRFLFASQGSAVAPGVEIVPAADPASEVFYVTKEILRLTEKEGLSFSDIGVLVRTTAPYQEEVRRQFAQNSIALNASFSYSLQQFPLGVFCLNLFALETNGFDRNSVLSLLSSPYLRQERKQKWRTLAEKSLVSMNLNQWRDLLPQTEGFETAFLAWLEDCHHRLTKLAQPGNWADQCKQAALFLKDNLDESALQGKEQEIYQAVRTCIDSLASYQAVRPLSHPGEFTRELQQALSALSFHEAEAAPQGVIFTDVQRARGLSFKVVFLLGMNEKVFPQMLAEDPIFRDRYRYILRDVLGYWVSQKAERTQEERLLFFTACSAALQRLYVSYACRGEDGKEQVPSVYVAELARATQKVWSAQEKPRVSARTATRLGTVPAEFWTPKEMSYMIMLQGAGPAAAGYCQAGLADDDTNRRLDAVAALKQHGPVGGFDGCIQSGPAVFAQAQQKGFSPSALQELAGCPLKYFFHRVLHLEDKEEVYSRQDLSPDKRGTAYHKILEDFYREMNRAQMTHQLFDSGVEMHLDRALTKHYTPQSYRQFGIYPVVWELLLEQIRTQLVAFVQEDVKALGSFTPSYFEREFPALELDGLPVRLRGIIDRIDLDTSGKTFFIVDYKSSRKWGKSVAESFFTQLIFQPFLYLLAAGKLPELAGFSPAGACLLAIRKGYERGELSMEQALEMSPRGQQFFTLLADLMQQGSFVCTPSSSCTYCPYGAICRKDSFSCLLRARKSGVAKQLEEARQHV